MCTLFAILGFGFYIQVDAQLYLHEFKQNFDDATTYSSGSYLSLDSVNTSGSWMIGEPQKIIFDSAYTQPNALITDTVNTYPINDSSSFSFFVDRHIPVKSNNSTDLDFISWQQKIDFEEGVDGGYIEFRTISDPVWRNIFDNPCVVSYI
ncbi:MAG: hypothetical protein MK212_09245 [Saprospiraceae bacterium]|nr:hypothetical protein [Saprospiraceae bacterium]